jgi:rhodanese-related sulfurtransferase
MKYNQWAAWIFLFLSTSVAMAGGSVGILPAFIPTTNHQIKPNVELMTADELKTKIARNEPLTIIDVRDARSYAGSDSKIKGAMHVKLRRLQSRLSFPPLKSVPRDSEIVTYCACPGEETSLNAAQILLDAGFTRVRVLKGGWQMWLKVNGQVEPRPKA